MNGPTIRVSIERKANLGNYQHELITIALSGVPFDATDELLAQMLETAERAEFRIREALREKVAGIRKEPNPAAFAPEITTMPEEGWGAEGGLTPEDEKGIDITASRPLIETEIPREEEIELHLKAFGVKIPMPPLEWCAEPITEVNADGQGRGQLVALNAALTAIGHGGKKRHRAINELLAQLYAPDTVIASAKDLTRSQAHMILSWIERADEPAFNALSAATGQPTLAGAAS